MASIKEILNQPTIGESVSISGWVRTFRSNRFIALSDGSVIQTIQGVVDFEQMDEGVLNRINTGTALTMTGKLIESQGKGQTVELQVEAIEIHGDADPEEYPLQPKKHSLDFLREKAHLRFRTN
ncbi:MAG: asparaginyl-tRNA synthetase, partial [Flammeovirgaceae bacterium]